LLNANPLDAPAIADGSPAFSEPSSKERLWMVIWSVTSLYWLFMTVTDVMVNWDFAGTELNGHYIPSSGTRMLSYLLECGISACMYQLAFHRRWPSTLAARVIAILYQIVLAIIFCVVAAVAMAIAMGTVEGRWWLLQNELAIAQNFEWSSWVWVFRQSLLKYALCLLLIALVRILRKYQREELRTARLSAAYGNARLGMLSAQLQPHFLFNSMHVITELVSVEPNRATEMLVHLGEFLRHALETSKQPWVSVGSEISGLEAYLALQQARFGERLRVDIVVDPATTLYFVPSLLLQPLVENAVEHGRSGQNEPLLVQIAVRQSGRHIHIVISNSMPTLASVLPETAYGYGLQNVLTRLKAAYGNAGTLSVGPAAQHGSQAELYLPIHEDPPQHSPTSGKPGRA
jgi:sensor histidine kinase YesM